MPDNPIPDSPEQMARQLRAIYASTSWRITAPLRWLGNALPALQRTWRGPPSDPLHPIAGATACTIQALRHDALPIPPRWPGLPAPAVQWRQQLDAALHRMEVDGCN